MSGINQLVSAMHTLEERRQLTQLATERLETAQRNREEAVTFEHAAVQSVEMALSVLRQKYGDNALVSSSIGVIDLSRQGVYDRQGLVRQFLNEAPCRDIV